MTGERLKPAAPAQGASGATVKVRRTTYGRILVDGKGLTLYLFTRDIAETKPGQVFCQDVEEFGGTWLIVSPAGHAIR